MGRGDGSATFAIQIARLFFERQLTKTEIGEKLGISRFRVARLIDQSLEEGLVTVEFRDILPPVDDALGRAVEERFGLRLCLAMQTPPGLSQEVQPDLARLAAAVLADLARPDEIIGVGWGSTIAAIAEHLPPGKRGSVQVIQLAGGSRRIAVNMSPSELARRFAERLGASYQALFAPAFVESPALRAALLRQDEMRETVAMFSQVTFAVLGVGAWADHDGAAPPSSLVAAAVIGHNDWEQLHAEGAIGDLLLYPFTAEGRFVGDGLAARAIGISLDQLRGVPRVMAVAGGTDKVRAIRGALSTGLLTILLTDATSAAGVLADDE
ncbi:MAG: hypothetical protein H0U86_17465 [Chloroflexi bacterium]|nr:hypothetical protein [Chloroflexota bacterium]